MNRINIQLDYELLRDLDSFAKRNSVSRSSAVCFLIRQQLEQMNVMKSLPNLIELLQTKSEDDKRMI